MPPKRQNIAVETTKRLPLKRQKDCLRNDKNIAAETTKILPLKRQKSKKKLLQTFNYLKKRHFE
ncbi:MAG TPA: hypothetical protein DHU79_04280 [Clostridiales bacterium]|nr:hypothetical protein [Clostridiales bacterium]